jgi:hypothetical protein
MEVSEHNYSWFARHGGVKWYFLGAIIGISIGQVFSFFEQGSIGITNYRALSWLLVGAFVLGYAHDVLFGVIRRGSKVSIGDSGMEIHAGSRKVAYVSWDDISSLDDFDFREQKNGEDNIDYWRAMGVGGVRIVTSCGKVYRIYKSIGGYDCLRSMIARKASNAKVMFNGKAVS